MRFSALWLAAATIFALSFWQGADAAAKKWGLSAVITRKAFSHVVREARAKLSTEVRNYRIPDTAMNFSAKLVSGTGTVSSLSFEKFVLPLLSFKFDEPNVIRFMALGGRANLTGQWGIVTNSRMVPNQAGTLNVAIANINFKLEGTVNTGADGRPQFTGAKCINMTMDLHVYMTGGTGNALDWVFSYFHGRIRDLILGQLQSLVCNKMDHLVDVVNDAIPVIVFPFGPAMNVDLSLTSDPSATEEFIRLDYKGAFFATGHPVPELEGANAEFVAKNPHFLINKEKMITLILTDASVNTFLKTLVHQPNLKLHIEDPSQNPWTFFRTTCPGYAPICLGRYIQKLGEMHPNCSMTMDLAPSLTPSPTVHFTPKSVLLSAAADIGISAVENQGGKAHNYNNQYTIKMEVPELSIVDQNVVHLGEVIVTDFNGKMKQPSMMKPREHDRFLKVGAPVAELFVNDFLQQNKIEIPANLPLRLIDPEIHLLDGAVVIETNFDVSKLFADIKLSRDAKKAAAATEKPVSESENQNIPEPVKPIAVEAIAKPQVELPPPQQVADVAKPVSPKPTDSPKPPVEEPEKPVAQLETAKPVLDSQRSAITARKPTIAASFPGLEHGLGLQALVDSGGKSPLSSQKKFGGLQRSNSFSANQEKPAAFSQAGAGRAISKSLPPAGLRNALQNKPPGSFSGKGLSIALE